MARMFRSTSQPYYARKADVVGNLSSKTLDMLNDLVHDAGNGTISLQLDPSNTDQGFISYNPPSNIGEEDDYFSFDSYNYSINLNLDQDGVIVVNSTGVIHTTSIYMEGQANSCSFELYINFPTAGVYTDDQVGVINPLLNYLRGSDNFKLVTSGLLSNINPTGTGIVLSIFSDSKTNNTIGIRYINIDTKEVAELSIPLAQESIKQVDSTIIAD